MVIQFPDNLSPNIDVFKISLNKKHVFCFVQKLPYGRPVRIKDQAADKINPLPGPTGEDFLSFDAVNPMLFRITIEKLLISSILLSHLRFVNYNILRIDLPETISLMPLRRFVTKHHISFELEISGS